MICLRCGFDEWCPASETRPQRYVACQSCGLTRIDPFPVEADALDLYQDGYFDAAANGGYGYTADAALHRRANRVSQHKVRTVSLQSSGSTVEVDLLRQNVTVYRNDSHEIAHESRGHSYRSLTQIDIPFVRHAGEALALQFAHFIEILQNRVDHVAERDRVRPPHRMHEIEHGG